MKISNTEQPVWVYARTVADNYVYSYSRGSVKPGLHSVWTRGTGGGGTAEVIDHQERAQRATLPGITNYASLISIGVVNQSVVEPIVTTGFRSWRILIRPESPHRPPELLTVRGSPDYALCKCILSNLTKCCWCGGVLFFIGVLCLAKMIVATLDQYFLFHWFLHSLHTVPPCQRTCWESPKSRPHLHPPTDLRE